MLSAIQPGNDICFEVVHVMPSCVRCQCRFWGEGELCPDCVSNPLFDRNEAGFFVGRETFEFMGWKFCIRRKVPTWNDSEPLTYLFCYKSLFNPEFPGGVYSQANFSWADYDRVLYGEMPERRAEMLTKRCAAWLIAHWWEHYLNICPCLTGERNDGEDSNFRRAVIESLLWYDEHMEAR